MQAGAFIFGFCEGSLKLESAMYFCFFGCWISVFLCQLRKNFRPIFPGWTTAQGSRHDHIVARLLGCGVWAVRSARSCQATGFWHVRQRGGRGQGTAEPENPEDIIPEVPEHAGHEEPGLEELSAGEGLQQVGNVTHGFSCKFLVSGSI